MLTYKIAALGILLSAAGHLARAQTTLHLTSLPGTTPAGSVIYIAGSFNNWQPAAPAYALARQPDGSYQLTLPVEIAGPQEFEFPRGSWATAEAHFRPLANRQATLAAGPAMRTFQVAAWQDQRPGVAPAAPRPHTLTANVRVLADSFRLPQLPTGAGAPRVALPAAGLRPGPPPALPGAVLAGWPECV